ASSSGVASGVLHGRKAVAALKPIGLNLRCIEAWHGSPRPKGRGRIEATPSWIAPNAANGSPRPKGRGRIEAPHHSGNCPHLLHVLHGRKAVAALKHHSHSSRPSKLPRSPRPKGRGRIEAIISISNGSPFLLFSTAERPWPH